MKLTLKPKQTNLADVMLEADIARLMGNPHWRGVFGRYALKATGEEEELLLALSAICNEATLDLAWNRRLQN